VSSAGTSVTLQRSVPASGLAEVLTLRLLVPVATMLTIGAVALLLLLTPIYLHPALDAAGAPAWLGMSQQVTHDYSDRTVGDLLFGPGTFEFAAPDGSPFYDASERGHMRDVRVVLYGFLGISAVAAGLLAAVTYRRRADASVLRAISRGGAWLAVGTVIVGVFAALAFDTAFELFHEIFFPGGNFSFDPTTERLVQLYPIAFWQLTTAVLGLLLVVGGALTWYVARRLAARKGQA
jgi:integral membrane protein (TIGR01906 family)